MKNDDLIIKKDMSNHWYIRKSNNWVGLNDHDFTPFLPLLELEPSGLKKVLTEAEDESKSLKCKFPLEELLLFALHSDSVYWIEKAINYVIELELKSEQIRVILHNYFIDKRINQKLRHKIRVFLN